MITEDYVSFEVAKLLKEKGFGEYTLGFYKDNEKKLDFDRFADDWNTKHVGYIAAPTHQMVLKWLRENNFHIIIDIEVDYDEDERGMKWYHKSAWYWIVYRIDDREQMSDNGDLYSTYEETCEAAIKYCLENLIEPKNE